MKFKKIIAILLAALMVFAVSGCSNGDSDTDTVSSDGRRILRVTYLKAGYGDAVFTALANKFMKKYPDVLVKLYPDENIDSNAETQLTSGKNVKDVYYASSWGAVRRWAVKGYVEDITELYTTVEVEDGKTINDVIMPHVKDTCKLYDSYWAIPNEASVNGLIYNEDMFEKYGWKVPTTTKELLDLCDQIVDAEIKWVDERGNTTNTKITPLVFGGSGNDGYWNAMLNVWWLQYSGKDKLDTFSKFESKEVYQDEGRLEALKVFRKVVFDSISDYAPANVMSKDAKTAQLDFLRGKAAMIPCGSWFETEMSSAINRFAKNMSFKMMATPMITDNVGNSLAKDENVNYLWDGTTTNWFIPKGELNASVRNVDDAKKWISFMCTQDALNIWTTHTGGIRPYKYDTSKTSSVYASATTFSKSLMDVWNSAVPYRFVSQDKKAILGYATLWPQQRSPFVDMYNNSRSAAKYYENDIEFVNKEWDRWCSVTEI